LSEHFDTYISTEESVISENSKIDRSKFNALIFDQFQSGLECWQRNDEVCIGRLI